MLIDASKISILTHGISDKFVLKEIFVDGAEIKMIKLKGVIISSRTFHDRLSEDKPEFFFKFCH